MVMGFWRGVGYFISILMIIVGFAFFPLGLVSVILGFIFIWMLKRSASQERMEKHLRNMDPVYQNKLRRIADDEQSINYVEDKERNIRYYKD